MGGRESRMAGPVCHLAECCCSSCVLSASALPPTSAPWAAGCRDGACCHELKAHGGEVRGLDFRSQAPPPPVCRETLGLPLPSPNQFPHCRVRVGLARRSQPRPGGSQSSLERQPTPPVNPMRGQGLQPWGKPLSAASEELLSRTLGSVWILEPRAGTHSALPLSNTGQATSAPSSVKWEWHYFLDPLWRLSGFAI